MFRYYRTFQQCIIDGLRVILTYVRGHDLRESSGNSDNIFDPMVKKIVLVELIKTSKATYFLAENFTNFVGNENL